MRLFFVLDETSFYQPNFFARFVEKTDDDVVGTAIVKKVPKKGNLNLYLATHFYFLGFPEILKLLGNALYHGAHERLHTPRAGGNFYSVQSVCRFYHIENFLLYGSVNQSDCLEKIASARPDVIVSSNSLIFGKRLLEIPRKCCINRHSSLLPAYGGLWPVFQAVRSGEQSVGVSIHTMESRIDKGILLSQIEIPIEDRDTVAHLYVKCFDKSVDALLIALRKIKDNDYRAVQNSYMPSYYSFPEKVHWKAFRRLGRRFI